jgi:hypothetical protein
MANTAPKFSKVELLIKKVVDTKGFPAFPSVTRLEYLDCGLMITGEYIIVIIDERDEINNSLTSTGKIYPMKDIVSYKTHAQ